MAVSSLVSQELGQEVDVKVEDMSLSPSHLDATIMINDVIKAEVEGFLSLLGEYDIKYRLSGEKLVFGTIHFEDSYDVKGKVKGRLEDFKIAGNGTALEGQVDFSLHHERQKDSDIKVDLKKCSTAKVFQLLGEKPLIGGTFTLNADIPLLSAFEKEGNIDLQLHRSGVYLGNIRDLYALQFPDDFMLLGDAKVTLTRGTYLFNADVESNKGKIKLHEGKYLESSRKVNAHYMLNIKELSELVFLTKKRFSGAFLANGEVEYHDRLRFDGSSDSLEGILTYYYADEKLEASLKDTSLVKLFKGMSYPPIMAGTINGRVDYEIDENIAIVNISSNDAHFQNSTAIQNIRRAAGVDLSQEVFDKTYFSSSVEEGIVSYDFRAENKHSYMTLFNTKMDSAKNTIESNFDLKMQGEELSGEIYGSLKSPKVKLDMGKYIEFKAKKEIDEFFGIGTTDKVKKELNSVDMDDVEGFIKGFF